MTSAIEPVPRARRATTDDLEQVVSVLVESHMSYAWETWAFPGDDRRVRLAALYRADVELLALPHGEVWITDGGESVAVWLPAAPTHDWLRTPSRNSTAWRRSPSVIDTRCSTRWTAALLAPGGRATGISPRWARSGRAGQGVRVDRPRTTAPRTRPERSECGAGDEHRRQRPVLPPARVRGRRRDRLAPARRADDLVDAPNTDGTRAMTGGGHSRSGDDVRPRHDSG